MTVLGTEIKAKKVSPRLLYRIHDDPLGVLMDISRESGDMAHYQYGKYHVYLLNSPEYVREVLVTNHQNFIKSRTMKLARRLLGQVMPTSEGEIHRKQRKTAQPAFQHDRIKAYADITRRSSLLLTKHWKEGQEVDIHAQMMRLTLDVIAKSLFNFDLESQAQRIQDDMSETFRYFTLLYYSRILYFDQDRNPLADFFEGLPLPANVRMRRAKQRIDDTIYSMIRVRREGQGEGADLLSMMLGVQEDGSRLSDEEVRDEVMTFFLAGHENTANALTWTWYLLSQHQEVEAKLHDELRNVLGDGLPSLADSQKLVYTENVLTESMRLYPPVWLMGRQAKFDCVLGGHHISAGSTLLMSQYVMHRNPTYFEEPSRFNPDRWSTDLRARLPKLAYFPFGAGPRVCLGDRFAWMMTILTLATIARDWRLRLDSHQRVEVQPHTALRPRNGMMMRLERRK